MRIRKSMAPPISSSPVMRTWDRTPHDQQLFADDNG